MFILMMVGEMSKFKLFVKQAKGAVLNSIVGWEVVMSKMFALKTGAVSLLLKLMMLGMLVLSLNSAQANDDMAFSKLRVYLNPAGAPFSFFTDNLKVLNGIDVDIINEMQKRLGFEIADNRIYPLDPSQAIERMKNKQIDFYGGGLAFSPELLKNFAALPIYIKSSMAVMYSPTRHPTMKSVKDLKGLKIGVLQGSSAEKFVQQFGGVAAPVNNLSFAVFMVTQGRLDAIIYDRLILEDFAKLAGSKAHLKILPDEFGKDLCQYTFYISKLSPFRRNLTSTLQGMLNDGTINRILAKWGVEIKQPPVRKRAKPVKAS